MPQSYQTLLVITRGSGFLILYLGIAELLFQSWHYVTVYSYTLVAEFT